MKNNRVRIVTAAVLVVLALPRIGADRVHASFNHLLKLPFAERVFAVDPDVVVGKVDARSPRGTWMTGIGWGLPPLFYRTTVSGLYRRVDVLYPFGCIEDSPVRTKLRFTPFVDVQWSKRPPFEGYSRWFTLFRGRSDQGQAYGGFFPFYGYSYRRHGVDHNFFLLFPLYYESTEEDIRTRRFLWPIGTYARSPGRFAFKIWPIFGIDQIRDEYRNIYVVWPIFHGVDKFKGTEYAYSYRAFPFPLFIKYETPVEWQVQVLYPFLSYYEHRLRGHRRYTFYPFITYGTGGGLEEIDILWLYYSKKERLQGFYDEGKSEGYISVRSYDVFTEKKFLFMSSIQKRYRRGCLIFARYRLWPIAEYTWDIEKGSHLKIPEFFGLRSDWWDLNMGSLFRIIDIRDTPITRELSYFFGLKQTTEIKTVPHHPPPPQIGDDNWAELISGAFGSR